MHANPLGKLVTKWTFFEVTCFHTLTHTLTHLHTDTPTHRHTHTPEWSKMALNFGGKLKYFLGNFRVNWRNLSGGSCRTDWTRRTTATGGRLLLLRSTKHTKYDDAATSLFHLFFLFSSYFIKPLNGQNKKVKVKSTNEKEKMPNTSSCHNVVWPTESPRATTRPRTKPSPSAHPTLPPYPPSPPTTLPSSGSHRSRLPNSAIQRRAL